MRRTKAFLAGAAALAVLTGCTGGGGGGAGTAEQSGGSGGGGAAPAPARNIATLVSTIGERSAQKRTVQADMQIGSPGGKGNISGTGELDLSRPASHFTLKAGPQGSVETIVADGVTYLKARSIPVAGGKPWAKLDKNSDNPLARFIGSFGDQARQADPTKTIDQVKAGGRITDTARETLAGQQTTRYTISVDLKKVAEQQKDPTLEQLMRLAVRSGVKQFPITMWVNREDLPVQLKVESPYPSIGQQQKRSSGALTTLVKYRDWGAPVNIQAPPRNQVGELKLPKLPQGLGQRPGGN